MKLSGTERKGSVAMDTAERLEAIEAIKQLKARYFRCMDEKDWDGQVAVFALDVEVTCPVRWRRVRTA